MSIRAYWARCVSNRHTPCDRGRPGLITTATIASNTTHVYIVCGNGVGVNNLPHKNRSF